MKYTYVYEQREINDDGMNESDYQDERDILSTITVHYIHCILDDIDNVECSFEGNGRQR